MNKSVNNMNDEKSAHKRYVYDSRDIWRDVLELPPRETVPDIGSRGKLENQRNSRKSTIKRSKTGSNPKQDTSSHSKADDQTSTCTNPQKKTSAQVCIAVELIVLDEDEIPALNRSTKKSKLENANNSYEDIQGILPKIHRETKSSPTEPLLSSVMTPSTAELQRNVSRERLISLQNGCMQITIPDAQPQIAAKEIPLFFSAELPDIRGHPPKETTRRTLGGVNTVMKKPQPFPLANISWPCIDFDYSVASSSLKRQNMSTAARPKEQKNVCNGDDYNGEDDCSQSSSQLESSISSLENKILSKRGGGKLRRKEKKNGDIAFISLSSKSFPDATQTACSESLERAETVEESIAEVDDLFDEQSEEFKALVAASGLKNDDSRMEEKKINERYQIPSRRASAVSVDEEFPEITEWQQMKQRQLVHDISKNVIPSVQNDSPSCSKIMRVEEDMLMPVFEMFMDEKEMSSNFSREVADYFDGRNISGEDLDIIRKNLLLNEPVEEDFEAQCYVR